MPIFKILIELKLRTLTGLVIKNLIVIIIKVYIRVYTRSLIRGLISKKNTAIASTIEPPILNSNFIFFTTRLVLYL